MTWFLFVVAVFAIAATVGMRACWVWGKDSGKRGGWNAAHVHYCSKIASSEFESQRRAKALYAANSMVDGQKLLLDRLGASLGEWRTRAEVAEFQAGGRKARMMATGAMLRLALDKLGLEGATIEERPEEELAECVPLLKDAG